MNGTELNGKIRPFTFMHERLHEGVVFSDGHVAIYGRIVGRGERLYEYEDLEEMLLELAMKQEDIHFL